MEQNHQIYCAHCRSKHIVLLGHSIPDNVNYSHSNSQLFLGCLDCENISTVTINNISTATIDNNTLEATVNILPVDKDLITYDFSKNEYHVKKKLYA